MKRLSGRLLASMLVAFFLLSTGCVKHKPVEPEEEDGHVVHRPMPRPKATVSPFIRPYDAEKDKQPPPKRSKLLPRVHVRKVETPKPRVLPADEENLFHQPSPFVKKRVALPPQPRKRPLLIEEVEKAEGNVPLDEAFPSQEKVFAVSEGDVAPEVAPLGPRGGVPRTRSLPRKPRAVRPLVHVVGRGDTLWSIAKTYNMTVKELVAANPGVNDANAIAVGMSLYLKPPTRQIVKRPPMVRRPQYVPKPRPQPTKKPTPKPVAVTRPATRPGVQVHILQPGETLWSVARKYRTTVTNLMILNRLGEASSLVAGRELYVPTSVPVGPTKRSTRVTTTVVKRPSVPTGTPTYKVQKGDSLWSISRRFGVTVNEILTWNNLTDLAHLPVGTVLTIKKPGVKKPQAKPTKQPTVVRTPHKPTKRPVKKGKGEFIWPLRGKLAQTFGWYNGRPHTGVDINGRLGAPVRAAASGTVIFSDKMRGYGNVIILDHGDGFFSVYGNLLANLVKKGTAANPRLVTRGAVIGKVGATVEGPTPHLHFEIRQKNKAINPLRYLPH